MQEVKFRAWDYKLGEMIIPILAPLSIDTGYTNYVMYPTKWHFENDMPENKLYLMQYTGLKDKNDKDIYDGDIVAIDMWQGNELGYMPELGTIKWHQESSAFKWFSVENDVSDGSNYWLSEADIDQREVMGNIYQNPELMV